MNALSKQKRAMRRAVLKPFDVLFKRFAAQLTKINNFLPIFSGLEATKMIPTK